MRYGYLIIYKIVYTEFVMYGLCGTGVFTVSKTLLCLPTHNHFKSRFFTLHIFTYHYVVGFMSMLNIALIVNVGL